MPSNLCSNLCVCVYTCTLASSVCFTILLVLFVQWSHYMPIFILHCFSYFVDLENFCCSVHHALKWRTRKSSESDLQNIDKFTAFIMYALKSKMVLSSTHSHLHNWNNNIAFRNYSIHYIHCRMIPCLTFVRTHTVHIKTDLIQFSGFG